MSIPIPSPQGPNEEMMRTALRVRNLEIFLNWAYSPQFPERGRISWLDGHLEIDLSYEEINSHNFLKAALATEIHNLLEIEDRGTVFLSGPLFVNFEANIATEPDVVFCLWESFESGRVHFHEPKPGSGMYTELRGSPDVVVEIVSRSSVRKDKQVLRHKYFEAGVQEYWLIDAQGDEIKFELLVRGTGQFRATRPGKDGSRLSGVFARRIVLTRELDRIGLWKYRVEWIEPRGS